VKTKTQQIRDAWARGEKFRALGIAAKFYDRGADTKVFQRGWNAHKSPDFYRQLGRDPEAMVAAALDLLARKFIAPRPARGSCQ